MQAKLRELGPTAMNAAEFERFSTMHKEGKLLPPDRYGFARPERIFGADPFLKSWIRHRLACRQRASSAFRAVPQLERRRTSRLPEPIAIDVSRLRTLKIQYLWYMHHQAMLLAL